MSSLVAGPLADLLAHKQSVALQGTIRIHRLDYGVGSDRNLPDGREIIGNIKYRLTYETWQLEHNRYTIHS